MKVDASPEMQSWIRQTEQALAARESAAAYQQTQLAVLQGVRGRSICSSDDTAFNAGAGATPSGQWMFATTNQGPDIQAVCTTGLLKVSVSCWMSARWLNTAVDTYGIGAMGFSVNYNWSSANTDFDELVRRTLAQPFEYKAGTSVGNKTFSGTYERVLALPPGSVYTLRSEYGWQHINASVQMQFANRTITAESI